LREDPGGTRRRERCPVGGASRSGSASARTMVVAGVRGVGSGGGGERGGRVGQGRRRPAILRAGGVRGRGGRVGEGGGGGLRNVARASFPPASDRMWRSPCHAGAHWTRHSCRGVGCSGDAGWQEGHVHTGAASICAGGGESGRQCACHQHEHLSHWKRGGPECWCPAPSPQEWQGARTSSSSSSASWTRLRTSTEEGMKPARRCF
jgi:hypothetical protein